MGKSPFPDYKPTGARGVMDAFYTKEFVEIPTTSDEEFDALCRYIATQLSTIVNGILPIKDDFAVYRMQGASDSGLGAMLYGKSNLPSFSRLPSMWTANMCGVVLIEEKENTGKSSIVIKLAGFSPEDAAKCFANELANALRPTWPNVLTANDVRKQEEEAQRKQAAVWASQGLCTHCGGQLGMFKKCKVCGAKN